MKKVLMHTPMTLSRFVQVIAVIIILLSILFLPFCSPKDITSKQRALLGEIRDACKTQIVEAYWLMYNHVPETHSTTSYHDGRQDEWEAEAYALMQEADQIACSFFDEGNKKATSFTFFKTADNYEGAHASFWYMMLEVKMTASYVRIYLIFAPFVDSPPNIWKAIDGQPFWFYYGEANI